MKISRIGVLILLVVLGSAVVFGDSVNDPTIIIRGTSAKAPTALATCEEGCVQPVGMNFPVGIPNNATGEGTLFFTNVSGKDWTSLILIEHGHQVLAPDINCQSYVFLSCTAKATKNGNVAIVMSGIKGTTYPGIPNGQNFSIQFACVTTNNGPSCWPGGLDFTAHAHVGAVPEPSTVALMMAGLAILVSRRSLWKNRRNS